MLKDRAAVLESYNARVTRRRKLASASARASTASGVSPKRRKRKVSRMKPNVENIQRVIDAIEKEYVDFDMAHWNMQFGRGSCGTTACIGGTANIVQQEDIGTANFRIVLDRHRRRAGIPLDAQSVTAAEYLGITAMQAQELFFCYSIGGAYAMIDKRDGIAMLELIKAGRFMSWERYFRDKELAERRAAVNERIDLRRSLEAAGGGLFGRATVQQEVPKAGEMVFEEPELLEDK